MKSFVAVIAVVAALAIPGVALAAPADVNPAPLHSSQPSSVQAPQIARAAFVQVPSQTTRAVPDSGGNGTSTWLVIVIGAAALLAGTAAGFAGARVTGRAHATS
jgi:hypothetical protein